MPDIIQLLSDDLANKIAAGEVVVRPAAVVKELLENAIDAGATEIQLFIKEGGKSLIQVNDNGSGMSATDARMSFERHATSKIKTIDDLFAINTMGFRGEALASISAVAKVELKTRLKDEALGTKIVIEGSELITQEPCQCAQGTSITVKSLFYNVPARRKFLKSKSTETRHILEEFQRVALAYPEIKMLLFNDEKETYHLQEQTLQKRIAQLFGKRNQERIVPVHEQTDIVSVSGFIGKPEFAKKSKSEQYFFVNNRFIKSGYLNHAVFKAYQDYINPKEYPLYVLNLTLNPENIDINVHPSKHEVKFEDEQNVYTIVSAAVRHALSKFSVTPTLDFETDPTFNRHEFFNRPKGEQAVIDNKTSKQGSATFLQRQGTNDAPTKNWQELYQLSDEEDKQIREIAQQQQPISSHFHQSKVSLKQINFRYILMEEDDGFLLIDQRRAHQRVIYESLLISLQSNGFPSQKLLFPETITINAQQFENFKANKALFNQLGFELEDFGQNTIIAHASPADLQIHNIEEFIETLLTELAEPDSNSAQEPFQVIAKHLALYGAIRYGQQLTNEEMQAVVQQLFQCEQPNYGIRKDKTYIRYNHNELNKAFSL